MKVFGFLVTERPEGRGAKERVGRKERGSEAIEGLTQLVTWERSDLAGERSDLLSGRRRRQGLRRAADSRRVADSCWWVGAPAAPTSSQLRARPSLLLEPSALVDAAPHQMILCARMPKLRAGNAVVADLNGGRTQ